MSRSVLRAFAAGLTVSAAAMFVYLHWFAEEAVPSITEPSVAEARQLLKEKGYIVKAAGEDKEKEQKPDTQQKADKKPDKKEPERIMSYSLVIEPGMTADEIAGKLTDVKVIEKPEPFIRYMEQNDLNKRIQIGTFVLSSDMQVKEIAAIIAPERK